MLSQAMHTDQPVYHRDIRQPNIMRRLDNRGWFLIDFCDATTTPTKAATHLTEWQHSPRVRQDNHGPEVDIWGIGRYMEDLASLATSCIAQPERVKQMARRWMDDLSTTAAGALEEIEVSIYHLNMRVLY